MMPIKDMQQHSITTRERIVKVVGRGMLAWAAFGMPLVTFSAYAQGLPDQLPTTQQRDTAVQLRTEDSATSDSLINKRASKLLSGRYTDDVPVRGPRIQADDLNIRDAKIFPDPDGAAQAQRQAERAGTKTVQEIVKAAEAGGAIGKSTYQRADLVHQTNDVDRVEPGVNQTSSGRSNLTEVMPGFNRSEMDQMGNLGAALYADPALTKEAAEQNRRNLRRDGCRRTQFVMRDRQNIDSAPTSANHRVLKVEFFDLVKEPIPGTNPVEYQTITKPSSHRGGPLNLQVATLGASSSVYWDKVDETHTIKYTYTPFTNPKGRNYFTYNHWLGYSTGTAVQRVTDAVVSYGSPADGFKPVVVYTPPAGVTGVYLSADLYQTQVTYDTPTNGVPCPSDPPETCEVPSIGGQIIRWCPGALGANIVSMYDDVQNPSPERYGKSINDQSVGNLDSRHLYAQVPAIRTGVIKGVNASSSAKAEELVGQCRREPISRIEVANGGSYAIPNMQVCSETLVNPFPEGCSGIKRSFGLSFIGEHNYLTVKAFNKVKVPIIDPITKKQVKDADGNPLFTYRKELANVQGPIDVNFPIMGAPKCPGEGRCSTEKPDDPLGTSEGPFLEYLHYPLGGDPVHFAIDGVRAQAGVIGNAIDYGLPSNQWLPSGTASGDGTLHEVRFVAKAYSVTINTFAGCEKYLDYVADGFCRGAKLTCKDTSRTRTVGGVTFGPGLPNQGIVELLKEWGTTASAVMANDYDNGVATEPVPNGPPIKLLDDPMCWEASAEPFTSCSTMDNEAGTLRSFMRDGQKWVTDCNIATDDKDVPLENSASCKRTPAADSCDTRFKGPFTGQCYNPTLAYDCGVTRDVKIPVVVEELGDTCSGAMRCLGTQCHRPNLTGSHGGDFTQALGAMSAINAMVDDMVCLETGEKPTSANDTCTPYIFGGKALYCKLPIGRQIGLTPDCCKEARKGASSAPSWMDYLQAGLAMGKIANRMGVMKAMQGSDIYNQISRFWGDIKAPVVDAAKSASSFVTENFITPFRAGFDNLFGGAANQVRIDAPQKIPGISGLIDQFQQQLMSGLQEILIKIGGEDLAGMVITSEGGKLVLTEGMKNLVMAFQIYSIARLIGHIIFACKKEEFEWGMNDKWRLCTFADTCCSKKIKLIGCVEKRQLYCCYKSIAIRVISTQIISKNLAGTRPQGFRSTNDGRSLGGCDINCGGFTAFELAAVDWSKVDLAEWTDALIESGQINPTNPGTNFGISRNTIKETMVISRDADPAGNFTSVVPAVKSAEILAPNVDSVIDNTRILQQDGIHCYDKDAKKMPFVYPGCRTSP